MTQDFSDFSMLDLFRMEVENQVEILNNNLLALESASNPTAALTSLLRAAHSIKGAARIVQVEAAVKVAHQMEDCFVAAKDGRITPSPAAIDLLLQGVDLLCRIAQQPEAPPPVEVETLIAGIAGLLNHKKSESLAISPQPPLVLTQPQEIPQRQDLNWGVRVSKENLNRLMGLAGESLVEANWLLSFADSLQQLRQRQAQLTKNLEKLKDLLVGVPCNQDTAIQIDTTYQTANACYQMLSEQVNALELFSRRSGNLSERLYQEVIAIQMRPFADGVEGFPRMVRDLAKNLGKQVKFEILGKSTQVDRDILEQLEAPLIQLLRNAIDHGIESPQERVSLGKSPEGKVQLEALHRAGMLSIVVSDDGRGIDLEQLRQRIVSKGMVSAEIAAHLTPAELLEFLFLPGFSTANTVTEISGRGMGLDIVKGVVQGVGGSLKAVSQPGKGMSFYLQLPLTRSVIRALLVEIAKEAYAFPLTRVEQLLMIQPADIVVSENRQFIKVAEENIGLVAAAQVLALPESAQPVVSALPVVIIKDDSNSYGLVVERFLGIKDLVIRPLEQQLGKVQDISAAALMEDSSIVLILDIDDLVRSIDKLLSTKPLTKVAQLQSTTTKSAQRILVVDDSITVREVERKLLENHGYQVEVCVNGIDAWNAVRVGNYDLLITDIDMPRMNGIELLTQIRNHPELKSLPVIVVSYKDREEDYLDGLDAGANYYLTKSSFHDNTLITAVIDLIG